MSTLTADRLRELLSYDPESGRFRWKVRRPPKQIGDVAGCLNVALGYRSVNVDCKPYYEHRLVWLFVHGEWPAETIDHIDGDRTNNRITNLRQASIKQNNWNTRRRGDTKTGEVGVTKRSDLRRYRAKVRHEGRDIHLGYHDTKEQASEAYQEAIRRLRGEFVPQGGLA